MVGLLPLPVSEWEIEMALEEVGVAGLLSSTSALCSNSYGKPSPLKI